jgi:hypothetical protein
MLANIRRRLQQRQKTSPFVTQLLDQAQHVADGAQALQDYVANPTKECALRVRDIERQADAVRRDLIMDINKAFITPIDREDLFGLSRAIDDVLDFIYSMTREMMVLRVEPNDHLRTMVDLLHDCAGEIHLAVGLLERDADAAGKHTMRVLSLQNRMDALYSDALADLYQGASTPEDIVDILKRREIYQHMVHAIESAEQAANLINDIIIKFY